MSDMETCDVLQELLDHFQKFESNPEGNITVFITSSRNIITDQCLLVGGVSVVSLISTCACLLICLLLNIYIAGNIIYKKKYQVSMSLQSAKSLNIKLAICYLPSYGEN